MNPQEANQALQTLLDGYRSTALLYVAAELGIPDLIADESKSSDELSASLNAHTPSLYRLLRGLAAIQVLSEAADGRFSLTPLGQALRTNVPGSLHGTAILCGQERMLAWRDLAQSALSGETAFNHVFGMSNWEYRKQHPELNAAFNAGIRQRTSEITNAVLAAYDFTPFHTIADIGGGHGALLAGILQRYPSMRGILIDQSHVLEGAGKFLESNNVLARCDLVSGNFLESISRGADIHILKSVLHDWDDASSLTILKNCHCALPANGTLLLVERILPTRAVQDPDTILTDIHMMAVTGGRERTQEQFRGLLSKAGFKIKGIVRTTSAVSIIESVDIS